MSKLAAIYGTTTEHIDDWRERALCRDDDAELWFSTEKDSDSQRRARHAANVCKVCPVREECLQFAVDNDERFGIWAGIDFSNRRTRALVRDRWPAKLPHDGSREAVNAHRRLGEETCETCKTAQREREQARESAYYRQRMTDEKREADRQRAARRRAALRAQREQVSA